MPPKKRNLGTVPSMQSAVKKPKNHFAIVVDSSGSMAHLSTSCVRTVNEILNAIKDGARTFGQETTVSLYVFSNSVGRVFSRVPAEQVQPFGGYYASGGTALFDAVGTALMDFQNAPDALDTDTSFLLMTVTDGEENQSSKFFAPTPYRPYGNSNYMIGKNIVELMKSLQATDRYTITFQLPVGYGRKFASNYGIPEGNIREWEQTERGMTEVRDTVTLGTQAYFNARSAGHKSVDSFYVKTDLSNLKKSDLKKLNDVSNRFKAWTVDKESDVKSFVESHGKKFVIGAVFYALTKKEKVQPQKAVLVMEKGSKAVYGGTEARNLIGLPQGANATVEPGNHANYDIYVQSTSVNRKLVRGTKVLFDTSLSVDLNPTWDHQAAFAAAEKKKGVTF